MAVLTVTLTVRITVNRPLQRAFSNRFVNGQRPSINPLTTLPVPYRFRTQQLAGSPIPTPNLLGAGTRYVPGGV
jgi:hypothetical protein